MKADGCLESTEALEEWPCHVYVNLIQVDGCSGRCDIWASLGSPYMRMGMLPWQCAHVCVRARSHWCGNGYGRHSLGQHVCVWVVGCGLCHTWAGPHPFNLLNMHVCVRCVGCVDYATPGAAQTHPAC